MIAAALALTASGCAGLSAWQCSRLLLGAWEERRFLGRRASLEDLLRNRVSCSVLFVACAGVVSCLLGAWLFVPCGALALACARRVPGRLDEAARERVRSSCDGQLDVLADIVAMGTGAGLSFDASLEMYCARFKGELSKRMHAALLSWRSGVATRKQALLAVAEALDSRAVARFAGTVTQAVEHGAPLAGMMLALADDLRRERCALVERQVAKAPVKMLIPMGTCILPALLIFIMGPLVLRFLESGV